MSNSGVIVFEGMRVGFLPGDLVLSTDPSKNQAILSTSYNVIPIWLKIAKDNVLSAQNANSRLNEQWQEEDQRKSLLISELTPSVQVMVACGVVFDAYYDLLKPFSNVTSDDIQRWKSNKTSRAAQIFEVTRRVFRFSNSNASKFNRNIKQIIHWRDRAVHPSSSLERTVARYDLEGIGVDWRFGVYNHQNAIKCFVATMEFVLYLQTSKSQLDNINEELERIEKAIEELGIMDGFRINSGA